MLKLILILISLFSSALVDADVNTTGTGVDNLNNLGALINNSINTMVPTTNGIFNVQGPPFVSGRSIFRLCLFSIRWVSYSPLLSYLY